MGYFSELDAEIQYHEKIVAQMRQANERTIGESFEEEIFLLCEVTDGYPIAAFKTRESAMHQRDHLPYNSFIKVLKLKD